MDIKFEDLDVFSEDGQVMVSLEWIGEGKDGDYDPDNSEDYPHIRFNVYRKYETGMETKVKDFAYLFDGAEAEEGEWMAVNDASYCTLLNATSDLEFLKTKAMEILAEVEDEIRKCHPIKKLCENLSWIA